MSTPDIYCDTRQQKGKHENIDKWFLAHDVAFEYKKLDFGDYIRADGLSNISIDTKQNISELAGNLGKDHPRFKREVLRANAAGFKLIVLIEQGFPYRCIENIAYWIPKRYTHAKTRPMQGGTLLRIIRTMERKYNIEFILCDKKRTARILCDILGVHYSEKAIQRRITT